MSLLSLARVAVTFVFSFALAKGTSFLAAMTIPRLVDAPSYGVVELAMTVGVLSSSVLGLGVPGAANRLYLVDKEPRAQFLLAGSCLWLAALGLVGAFVLAWLDFDTKYVVCGAILGLYGLQFSASTFTRMRGFIHFSGWFDNVALLVVCALLAVFATRQSTNLESFTRSLIVLSGLLGMAALVILVRAAVPHLREIALRALSIGFPMMLFGASSLLIFGTLRIALGRSLTLSDVASYSLCARVTLLLVFISQVLATGFFRQLYQMESADVSRIFTAWVLALAGASTVLAIVAHFTSDLLVIGTAIPAGSVKAIFPAVTVQTALWILNSNLEMYIVRELLARKAALIFVLTAAAALAVGLLLHALGMLGLLTIINLYSVAMAAVLVMQMRVLSRHGVNLERCYLGLPLVGGPLLVSLLP
jgi:O-antigen/teichoic acid export membrane protein